jgi:hypothetical protein
MMMTEKTFKRFMVFESFVYSGRGGMDDCEKSFDTEGEAIKEAKGSTCDYVSVFDRIEGKIILEINNYD